MSYYQVSEENLKKVESYFVNKVTVSGAKRFEATIVEIAEGSSVALATAHKAIKQLEEERKIQVIRPSSRRFPISYIYNGDIIGFEQEKSQQSQIEYLQETIHNMQNTIDTLEKANKEQAGIIRIFESRFGSILQ